LLGPLLPSQARAQASTQPWPKYHRIVSLKPNLTEILFALGVGDALVGVTTFCDEPPEARKIDKVADYIQPDLEKIVMKRPDLIVTSQENSSKREIFFLKDRGYKVLTLEAEDFGELRKTLSVLGEELGRAERARELIQTLDTELSALKEKVRRLFPEESARPTALFVVGHQPIVVAGGGNIFDEAAPYLGLRNVAGKNRFQYPTYSLEMVMAANPDFILDFSMGSEAQRQEVLKGWARYPALKAVKNGKIFFIDMGKMRVTPRLPRELAKLFEMIHNPVLVPSPPPK